MALPGFSKRLLDGSMRLGRAPIDLLLGATGREDSTARFALDRFEAGARSATGTLLRDRELQQDGRRRLLAVKERERALGLREDAERVRHEGNANLRDAAAEARRESERLARSSRLEEVAAKEQRLEAKVAASAARKEAEKLKKVTAKAKKARKKAS